MDAAVNIQEREGCRGDVARAVKTAERSRLPWRPLLGLCASTVGGMGSIPGRGTRIPHASRCGQNKNKKQTNKLLRGRIREMETSIAFAVSQLWVALAWVFPWDKGTKKTDGE